MSLDLGPVTNFRFCARTARSGSSRRRTTGSSVCLKTHAVAADGDRPRHRAMRPPCRRLRCSRWSSVMTRSPVSACFSRAASSDSMNDFVIGRRGPVEACRSGRSGCTGSPRQTKSFFCRPSPRTNVADLAEGSELDAVGAVLGDQVVDLRSLEEVLVDLDDAVRSARPARRRRTRSSGSV